MQPGSSSSSSSSSNSGFVCLACDGEPVWNDLPGTCHAGLEAADVVVDQHSA